jgi:hypothetical protein
MRKILLLIIIIVFASCNKSKCRPYLDAVRDGSIPRKTTTLTLSDNLIYELDYVRDQLYNEERFFCFGYLEQDYATFNKAADVILAGNNYKNVHTIDLLCDGADICHDKPANASNIKGLLVQYADEENRAWMDHINLITGEKKSYRDSGGYASIKMYLLMEKSGLGQHPSCIELRNKDRDMRKLSIISRWDDKLYLEAIAHKKSSK